MGEKWIWISFKNHLWTISFSPKCNATFYNEMICRISFVKEFEIYRVKTLQSRHNERDGASNHQPHDCLQNYLFRHRSKKTSKVCVTGLCSIPCTKGQLHGKVFHLMTSSWIQWRQPESKLQFHKQFCWICWHWIHFYIIHIQEGCCKININAVVCALFEAHMHIMYLKTCNFVKSIRVFYNVILASLKLVLICIFLRYIQIQMPNIRFHTCILKQGLGC